MLHHRVYTPPRALESYAPDDLVLPSLLPDNFSYLPGEYYSYADGSIDIEYKKVAIFVDGSCLGNGTDSARAGLGVFFGRCSSYNISKPLLCRVKATNQRAEIFAAILALMKIEHLALAGNFPSTEAVLITDSAYIVNAMTRWIVDWKNPTTWWTRADGKPVDSRREFEELDNQLNRLKDVFGISVRFWLVPRTYNTRADELARKAASRA
ncbi:Ribonuclease H1 [Leucoagaricus sp. SymC.cos]|nr:Ribonuclease H1 [Leucoagaricus sp. SymC.cos]